MPACERRVKKSEQYGRKPWEDRVKETKPCPGEEEKIGPPGSGAGRGWNVRNWVRP